MEFIESHYDVSELVALCDNSNEAAQSEMTFDDMLNSIARVTLDH